MPPPELIFKEDADIAIAADEWQQKLFLDCCRGIFIDLICTIVILLTAKGNFWEAFFAVFLMTLFIGYFSYNRISGTAGLFNKTAIEIHTGDNQVWIRTMPFKCWFIVDKPSKELCLPRNKIEIIKIGNPYPHLFTLNKFVIRLRCTGEELYVIPEYFPKGMEAELRKNRVFNENADGVSLPGR